MFTETETIRISYIIKFPEISQNILKFSENGFRNRKFEKTEKTI